jgi:rubrerythrin
LYKNELCNINRAVFDMKEYQKSEKYIEYENSEKRNELKQNFYLKNKDRILSDKLFKYNLNKDKFTCNKCNYKCAQNSNLIKHKLTEKHINNSK